MTDIALIGDRTFLFEKLFEELGVTYQFLQPGVLGSPFLPQYRMVMIPTGFANPEYSKTLPALQRMKSNIADFVKKGGVLTVFGPLVPEHDYEWLPLKLKYVCELGAQNVAPSEHECSCLLCTFDAGVRRLPDARRGLRDRSEGCRRAERCWCWAKYGEGSIVATSVHEFPAAEYIKWALGKARPAKI